MKNRNLKHKDDWQTPPEYMAMLNREFDFNFDPCPYQHNIALWDGLAIDWKERNFINPPYSRNLKEAFVIKAVEQSRMGKLCVCLLPVSTSTKLFHNYILPYSTQVRFLYGRVKFIGVNAKGEPVKNKTGQHDSMLITFDGREPVAKPVLTSPKPHCWGKMNWILQYEEGKEPESSICRCEHGAIECKNLTRNNN